MMKDLNSLNEPSTFDNDDRVTKLFLWMFRHFTYHKEIATYIFIYNWITMFRNIFFKLNRLLNEFDRLISESILVTLKIKKCNVKIWCFLKNYDMKQNQVILSDFPKKSNLKFASGTNNVMGKKKVIPIQPVRKSSNGMVWPLQQIPMLEVSIKVKKIINLSKQIIVKILFLWYKKWNSRLHILHHQTQKSNHSSSQNFLQAQRVS